MTISVGLHRFINYNKIYTFSSNTSIDYEDHCFVSVCYYLEIYVKMNCIILNSFPIMCFKGAPVLATFYVSMGASLTNYLVLFSHLPVRIRKYMYIFLCVHLREVGGPICHSSPYIL